MTRVVPRGQPSSAASPPTHSEGLLERCAILEDGSPRAGEMRCHRGQGPRRQRTRYPRAARQVPRGQVWVGPRRQLRTFLEGRCLGPRRHDDANRVNRIGVLAALCRRGRSSRSDQDQREKGPLKERRSELPPKPHAKEKLAIPGCSSLRASRANMGYSPVDGHHPDHVYRLHVRRCVFTPWRARSGRPAHGSRA